MPGPRVHIDAEWLRDAYDTRGMSLSAIAAETGASASTVCRRMRAYGLPTRAPGSRSTRHDPHLTAADVVTGRYLTEAIRRGFSAAQIGRDTGLNSSTVLRHLRAHG